ncbi:MAG: phosphoribosyltransferase family protein [Acidilobaceae archaeon]
MEALACSKVSELRRGVVYCEDYSWRVEVFADRAEAGRALAGFLKQASGYFEDSLVVALAAGGVPVAFYVAEELGLDLDVVVVKKITFPWTTEAGFGAVDLDGSVELEERALPLAGYTPRELEEKIRRLVAHVRERTLKLRGSLDYSGVRDRRVILVDDGIATGYTARVAAAFLRRHGASSVTLAAPTASLEGAIIASERADETFVLNLRAGPYYAVADAYREWHDVSDEEALEYLSRRRKK